MHKIYAHHNRSSSVPNLNEQRAALEHPFYPAPPRQLGYLLVKPPETQPRHVSASLQCTSHIPGACYPIYARHHWIMPHPDPLQRITPHYSSSSQRAGYRTFLVYIALRTTISSNYSSPSDSRPTPVLLPTPDREHDK